MEGSKTPGNPIRPDRVVTPDGPTKGTLSKPPGDTGEVYGPGYPAPLWPDI